MNNKIKNIEKQNKLKFDKKGADKIISVYWFFILFIVAAGVAYMVFSFYGKPYDIRELEVNTLTNKVADCVSYVGYLRDDALTISKENLLEKCDLNFNVEDVYDWRSQKQYYVEIEILDFKTKSKISEASSGNLILKNFCSDKSGNSPFCLQRSFYALGKNENENVQYQINIFSIVRKTEKNA